MLGLEIDIDVLLACESEVEVQRQDEVRLGGRSADNEVVEVRVAVPHVVVVEKTPVYAILAEEAFVESHLPP